MSSMRRRQVSIDDNPDIQQGKGLDQSNEVKRGRTKLVVIFFAVTIAFVVGMYIEAQTWNIYIAVSNILDAFARMFAFEKVYAVVIDAGSTGSRVLAFTFYKSIVDGSLKLDHELFREVKPGLSSFVDDPKQAGKQIQSLIESALTVIPEPEQKNTPIVLKATAGFRLLPNDKANILIREIEDVFKASPLHVTDDAVSIMDGTDEGLFSWFTVNFLQDNFRESPQDTTAALDLGGGSTQITFATHGIQDEAIKLLDIRHIHQIQAFHQTYNVYTQSYLGLGLMAARHAILTTGLSAQSNTVASPCINPIVNTTWEYHGTHYTIRGSKQPSYIHIEGTKSVPEEHRPIVNFKECETLVQSYVSKKIDRFRDLSEISINAFSYYFDRASEVGLIDQNVGGVVTVNQFLDSAESVCKIPNVDQPFMCLDLTFISILLKEGFGLHSTKKIKLYKKIDNHEISWALGAAYHVLENRADVGTKQENQ